MARVQGRRNKCKRGMALPLAFYDQNPPPELHAASNDNYLRLVKFRTRKLIPPTFDVFSKTPVGGNRLLKETRPCPTRGSFPRDTWMPSRVRAGPRGPRNRPRGTAREPDGESRSVLQHAPTTQFDNTNHSLPCRRRKRKCGSYQLDPRVSAYG